MDENRIEETKYQNKVSKIRGKNNDERIRKLI